MPRIKKQVEKLKHPNSRKTKAIVKHMKKQNARQKNKISSNIRLNLLGEKIKWFQEQLDPSWNICVPNQVSELILKYLGRFDDELEQIKLKQSVGNRKHRQHASREDIIKMTIKREFEEYNTCGIEMPDLLDTAQFKILKEWSGELRFIQNFKLKRISKANLEEKQKSLTLVNNMQVDN